MVEIDTADSGVVCLLFLLDEPVSTKPLLLALSCDAFRLGFLANFGMPLDGIDLQEDAIFDEFVGDALDEEDGG